MLLYSPVKYSKYHYTTTIYVCNESFFYASTILNNKHSPKLNLVLTMKKEILFISMIYSFMQSW